MNPEDIKMICCALSKEWSGSLGIHTHNNKNLALINSITAIENGVNWCDSTIAGMGRGAGNVPTESLLLELLKLGLHSCNPNMIQPSVEDFTILKNKYGWGSNFYYHFAANNNIHPTFVQSLLEDRRYNNQDVLSALEFLAERDSTSFSIDAVREAIYGEIKFEEGTWDATGWLDGKEVIIVGAGPSVEKYKEGILRYIEKAAPEVIFLNINQHLPSQLAKATIVSHQTRVLFDAMKYQNLNHPIVLPEARLGTLIGDQLKSLTILDYGLTLEDGSFIIGPNSCRLQWPLAAAYSFGVVTQAGASKISLVGFDGYPTDHPRQEEMNEVFSMYIKLDKSLKITSLTPTNYQIEQSSIFAPIID
jgi:4-hydroxy 2-oxovalerate aldolase